MKKITLLGSVLLLTVSTYAQIYFRAGGGYALPLATQGNDAKSFTVRDDNGDIISGTSELIKTSYGAGVNFSVGMGYMFSKHIGAEVNFSYLLGKEFESSGTTEMNDESQKFTVTTKSKALYITPALIISAGEGKNVPYGKFGLVLGAPHLDQKAHYAYGGVDGDDYFTASYKYQKGMSFGFMGAVGMNWRVSNSIDIVTEINFISMAYYPKELILTGLEVSGEKRDLDEIDEIDKRTVFKKKISLEEDPDPDKPQEALQESMPFSSISLQVGVVYFLGRNAD